MIPTLQKQGCSHGMAVLQHDNDPKHTSKMAAALKLKIEGDEQAKYLNQYEHLWHILKQKAEESMVS